MGYALNHGRKMAGCQSQEGRAGHGLVRELAIGGCAAISISKGALGSALRAVQFFQRLLKVKNANSDGCRFDEVAEKKEILVARSDLPGRRIDPWFHQTRFHNARL
jgi:hypothetical protein